MKNLFKNAINREVRQNSYLFKSGSHSNQAHKPKNQQLQIPRRWYLKLTHIHATSCFTKLSILRPYTIVNTAQNSFQNVNLSFECETEKIITSLQF